MALGCARFCGLVIGSDRLRSWRLISLVVVLGLIGSVFAPLPAYAQTPDEDACLDRADGKNPIYDKDPNDPIIYGTPKSDHICGSSGRDIIIGGLLDDDIYGGGGNDLIIGGHGTDRLVGQSGNDWLRGGDNEDINIGGPGNDTVSFADVTPVGGDEPRGVRVNLQTGTADIGNWDIPDYGFRDTLNGVEDVVGSAFNDKVITPAGSQETTVYGGPGDDELRGTGGNDHLHGEQGLDTCYNEVDPATCESPGPQVTRTGAAVYGATHGADRGIVVLGTDGPDNFLFAKPGSQQVRVTGGALESDGAHCTGPGPVNCMLDANDDARYVVVWGGDGTDAVTFADAFQLGPGELKESGINAGTVDVNGGDARDVLKGALEDEVLFSGESGDDVLTGGPGADALISEGTGADTVHAGAGDDQIVTDNACAGHHFWGEGDRDIIGFARQSSLPNEPDLPNESIKVGVDAQLGGGGTSGQARAIRADGSVLGNCVSSTLYSGSEVLEGTEQHDVLRGGSGDDTIWGRDSSDDVSGGGGADHVYGHRGDDNVIGGNGSDWLYGGPDSDSLDARETPDAGDETIDCGPGRDQPVKRGPGDRHTTRCEHPTQASATVSGTLNGGPGYGTVSGDVLTSTGEAARGYVTVTFDRYVNGTWTKERTAQRTLVNGHYEVKDMRLPAGLWSARAVFADGQNDYDGSSFTAPNFEIKDGYQIVARHSGKCLDVYNSGTANSQAIHQRGCLNPMQAPNQVFSLVPKNGAFQIVARHSGKCVDVVSGSYNPGAGLQQYDCAPAGQGNQLWQREQIAAGSPYYRLRAVHSSQCMDVQGGATADGTRAIQGPCTDGRLSQNWELRPVRSSPIPRNVPPGGFNTVTHAAVERTVHGQPGYVTVTGDVSVTNAPGENANGAYLHVYFSKWENGQWVYKEAALPTVANGTFRVDDWRLSPGKWRVMVAIPAQGPYNQSQSADYEFEIKSGYEIVARHSDKCMTLVPNSTVSGGTIDQQACTSTPIDSDQVFTLMPMGGGYYQIKINTTGDCLDVSWASPDDGARLQQWECAPAGQDNQLWKAVPLANGEPYVTLQVKHTGKCADVAYGSSDEGMFIQQWTCTASYTHQHWTLQAVD